jgi:folate-binding protein YgfZ
MNQWTTLLAPYHITLADNQRAISAVPKADSPTRIVPLIHQRVISVLGPDAEKFLQGQLTCDMREVSKHGSRLGAHCTIKGSIIALYRLITIDNGFLLRLNHEAFDLGLQTLKKYIMFSKAEAVDESENWLGFGLLGPGADALVEQLLEGNPLEVDCTVKTGNLIAVKVPVADSEPGNRYELWVPAEQAEGVLKKLTDRAPLGTTNDWLLTEVDAGIPEIDAKTQESYIPQMTNLQALKGVSFAKGCYTGQEIITRLQHRGKLNKPMYLLSADTQGLPSSGDAINTETKQNIGQVLSAARVNDHQVHLLAVITKSQADEHPLSLADGTALNLLDLPYELDPELFVAKR